MRFVVASDGHYGDPDDSSYPYDYEKNHDNMMDMINGEDPDVVFFNGDNLCHPNDGMVSAGEHVRDTYYETLNAPYYVSHGNHDAMTDEDFHEVWGQEKNTTVEVGDVGFILTDTWETDGHHEITPDINFLENSLDAFAEKEHVFVLAHLWFNEDVDQHFDSGGTASEFSEQAVELIHTQDNVRGAIHGHNHTTNSHNVYWESHSGVSFPYIWAGTFGGVDAGGTLGYRVFDIDTGDSGSIETEYKALSDGSVLTSDTLHEWIPPMEEYTKHGSLETERLAIDGGKVEVGEEEFENALVDGLEVAGGKVTLPEVLYPDSVVLQYFATNVSGGNTTWPDDNGVEDMALTGGETDGTLSDDSQSLDSDGVDDHGLIDLPDTLNGASLQTDWTVELAVQWDFSGGEYFGVTEGDQRIHIRPNIGVVDGDWTGSDGDIGLELRDNSGNDFFIGTDGLNLDDGNRHDITMIVEDTETNDAKFIIDGAEVTANVGRGDSPNNWVEFTEEFAVYGRNHDSTIESTEKYGLGAMRFHDEAIGEQTIDDYS